MQLSDEEWKSRLTPEQYRILRQKGTEPPFSGKYVNTTEAGVYRCAACGEELFMSDHKFESSAPGLMGWPSFYDIAKTGTLSLVKDESFGMERVEVQCANCGSHLGHLFEEATDQPQGKHYCINSISLDFEKKSD